MLNRLKSPVAISIVLALLITIFCAIKLYYYYGPIALESDPYDRYTVLAESILHGTLETGSFDHKFPENSDPYEPEGRQGVFWWDFSYYKGKQYHYASFLPSLLFNIPFKFVFGFYPGPKIQVLFSTFFAAFAINILIFKFRELFVNFDAAKHSRLLRGVIFLSCLSGSGIFLSFADDSIYTIPAYQGLAFLSLAFYFLLTSRQNDDTGSWVAASLLYALAVASRPTLLFYGPVFLAICLTFSGQRDKLKTLAILSSFGLVCAVVLGSINYLRFESPLEFGNRFQLNEFNNYKYPFVPNSFDLLMQRLPRGLWFHLFNHPRIFSHFQIALWPLSTPAWAQSFIRSPMGGQGMLGTLVFLPVLILTIPAAVHAIAKNRDWKSTFIAALLVCSVWVLFFQASLIWVADRYALDYRLYLTLCGMSYLSWFVVPRENNEKAFGLERIAFYGCLGWTCVMSIIGSLARYHG